jgi:predicted nucleic acid-binding protein
MARIKMRKYVIDASLAVKWYSSFREDDLIKADNFLNMYMKGGCKLVAPSLISYELANALRFNPNFNYKDVIRAMKDFFELQISIEAPSGYIDHAIKLAFDYSLTIYDAIYAALAQLSGIPLITADYAFCAKVKNLPFIIPLSNIQL